MINTTGALTRSAANCGRIRCALAALAVWGVALASNGPAATFQEDFSQAPATHGWTTFGDASLFQWNASAQALEVIWDSSRTNSFFHRPLGNVVTKRDDFAIAFELRLQEVQVGTTAGKPYAFELAVGLLSLGEATGTNYWRGTGMNSPNLLEFDYFPDAGFGATISPTIISTNHQFATSFNFPLELSTNDLFRIVMNYTASNQTLVTTVARNGQPFGPIKEVVLATNFTDFQVDYFAISSYSDAGQDPQFGGSIRARGVVDNIEIQVPESPLGSVTGRWTPQGWETQGPGHPGWRYTLERTVDFRNWQDVVSGPADESNRVTLVDPTLPLGQAFYRVRAERP